MTSEECLHRTNALIFTICCCCLVTKSYLTFLRPPRTVVHQASLTMGFPRQEYWSGLPFPFPGDLPNPETEPSSPGLADGFFALSQQGSPSGTGEHLTPAALLASPLREQSKTAERARRRWPKPRVCTRRRFYQYWFMLISIIDIDQHY